ncbi:MAG: BatA domain-containing protein, partial [Planctomycetota bacterium]
MSGGGLAAPLLATLDVLQPTVLWGLLLLVPLVLLHLHHRRRRLVVVFLPLLTEAHGRRRPGGGWRRLRDRTSLLLQALAATAAVVALAGLGPKRVGPKPQALVLVVDADPTTAAVERDGRPR